MELSDNLKNILSAGVLCELEKISNLSDSRDKLQSLKKLLTLYETHTDRMVPPTLIMGSHLGLQKEQLQYLEQAAILHDIGKIGVPKDLLETSKNLSADEMDVIRKHPEFGREIVKYLGFSDRIAEGVEHHHQRYDGKGYPPPRLAGKDIPLIARILSIMDAFDAITSDRPYHDKIPFGEAYAILSENSGTQFDPDLIRLFKYMEQPVQEFEDVVKYSKDRTASNKQMLHTYLELCKFYISFGYCDAAHQHLKEAEKWLDNDKTMENVRMLRLKGRTIFYAQGKNALSEAIKYIEESLVIAHEIEDQTGIGKGFFELLNITIAVGEKTISPFFSSSILKESTDVDRFFQDGLAASTSAGDFKTAADLINEMIYLLTMRGRASDALFLMGGQEKLLKKINQAGGINILFYNHVAIAYQAIKDYKTSIEYFDKAIQMARDRVANRELQWVLNGKGFTLLKCGEPKKALVYFIDAHKIAKELMDYREISLCLTNLGQTYLELKEFEKAYETLKEAYTLKKERYPNMENAPEGIHGSFLLEILMLKSKYMTGRINGMTPMDDLKQKYNKELEESTYLMENYLNLKNEIEQAAGRYTDAVVS